MWGREIGREVRKESVKLNKISWSHGFQQHPIGPLLLPFPVVWVPECSSGGATFIDTSSQISTGCSDIPTACSSTSLRNFFLSHSLPQRQFLPGWATQSWLTSPGSCWCHLLSSQDPTIFTVGSPWCANSKPSPLLRPCFFTTFLLCWLILGELPSLTVFWDISLRSPFYLRTFLRSPSLRESR